MSDFETPNHDGMNEMRVAAGAMVQRMTTYWIYEVRGKRPAAYPGHKRAVRARSDMRREEFSPHGISRVGE